ncbi:hypothetical protein EVAR_79479_1 [Eumeta japonica]|uniref:Uncharacterized protein n=1 Tax=Eumeta variegata TaxID=151549 RepID=A0A4C1UEL8_EUMVA|nr:hypothetical protein EVAR_79479_1 [Eumeta japonica]
MELKWYPIKYEATTFTRDNPEEISKYCRSSKSFHIASAVEGDRAGTRLEHIQTLDLVSVPHMSTRLAPWAVRYNGPLPTRSSDANNITYNLMIKLPSFMHLGFDSR